MVSIQIYLNNIILLRIVKIVLPTIPDFHGFDLTLQKRRTGYKRRNKAEEQEEDGHIKKKKGKYPRRLHGQGRIQIFISYIVTQFTGSKSYLPSLISYIFTKLCYLIT